MVLDDTLASNIASKLQQDSDWLKSFEENLERSNSLSTEITALLESFQNRLIHLDQSVIPLHAKTSLLQRKQANIRKVLKIVDAMQQFYGRAAELESSIREGNASVEREQFTERMDQLAEAISFFSSHPTYQYQLDSMKLTFESGCCALEKEFKNVLQADSVAPSAEVIIECLDSEFEVIPARLHEIASLRNPERSTQIARWLLAHNPKGSVIQTYANVRCDNIMRTLSSLSQHDRSVSTKGTPSLSAKSAVSLKSALKKAAGRSSEKHGTTHEWRVSDSTVDSILTFFAVLLALIEIETEVMSKVLSDVSVEARVQQLMFGRPLCSVVERGSRLLDNLDCSLIPLLPLLKHINAHYNQLLSLANNAVGNVPYDAFVSKVRAKAMATLDEFLDHLTNDTNKFVPADGNVHQITSNTLNFLNSLMEYRQTVTSLLSSFGTKGNPSTQFPRLFARTLSGLGLNLKNKADMYNDETLAAIFLLNNNNYIHNVLQNHGMFSVVCEHNSQVRSFYRSEIGVYIKKYLQRCQFSWNRVASIVTVDFTTFDDKQTSKNALIAFNAELERVLNAQQEYCLSDAKLAEEIKSEIRSLVCEPYAAMYARMARCGIAKGAEKYVKYTPESLEMVIDRLFNVGC